MLSRRPRCRAAPGCRPQGPSRKRSGSSAGRSDNGARRLAARLGAALVRRREVPALVLCDLEELAPERFGVHMVQPGLSTCFRPAEAAIAKGAHEKGVPRGEVDARRPLLPEATQLLAIDLAHGTPDPLAAPVDGCEYERPLLSRRLAEPAQGLVGIDHGQVTREGAAELGRITSMTPPGRRWGRESRLEAPLRLRRLVVRGGHREGRAQPARSVASPDARGRASAPEATARRDCCRRTGSPHGPDRAWPTRL